MKRFLLLFFFLLSLISVTKRVSADNENVTQQFGNLILCYVIRVVDGDTIHCYLPNTIASLNHITVRLYGIDAFEIRRSKRLRRQAKQHNLSLADAQRLGQQQKQALEAIVRTNKSFVWLKIIDKDVYGRYVAIIYNLNFKNINCLLLQQHRYINKGLDCSKKK